MRVLPIRRKRKIAAGEDERARRDHHLHLRGDILTNKTRQDFGITYDVEVMRIIDTSAATSSKSTASSSRATRIGGQHVYQQAERRGIRTYRHNFTKGYPIGRGHDRATKLRPNAYWKSPSRSSSSTDRRRARDVPVALYHETRW